MNSLKEVLENAITEQIEGTREIKKSKPRHLRRTKIKKLEAQIESKLKEKYGLSLYLPEIFRKSVVIKINDKENDFEDIQFYKKLEQIATKNSFILKTRKYPIGSLYVGFHIVKHYRFTKSPLLFSPAILTLDPAKGRLLDASFLGILSDNDLIKVKRTDEGYKLLEYIIDTVYKDSK